MDSVAIIGAGLAGSEAAWQLANAGIHVDLFEMRPGKSTPVHQTDKPAELVCSNSFKSMEQTNAHGLLKEELKIGRSFIISEAEKVRVPAGKALTVDRLKLSENIFTALKSLPNLKYVAKEIEDPFELADSYSAVLIATGPMTSESIINSLQNKLEIDSLFFFDAIAPTILKETIDFDIAFWGNRYDDPETKSGDYINCPMTKDEYSNFYDALISAPKTEFKDFEGEVKHFEGCLPIEELASRHFKALVFGPMKPVGFIHPKTGRRPYALVQLRPETINGELFSAVGCQTKLKISAQSEVFRLIPGLKNAEFARYGSIHRNFYVNSPKLLNDSLKIKICDKIFLAGQITGVEGYTESVASGFWAANSIISKLKGLPFKKPSNSTMIGGLMDYVANYEGKDFQPMNANFGLMNSPEGKLSKIEKRKVISERALSESKILFS